MKKKVNNTASIFSNDSRVDNVGFVLQFSLLLLLILFAKFGVSYLPIF